MSGGDHRGEGGVVSDPARILGMDFGKDDDEVFYTIQDSNDETITEGVSEHIVEATAQQLANERGETVSYYSEGSDQPVVHIDPLLGGYTILDGTDGSIGEVHQTLESAIDAGCDWAAEHGESCHVVANGSRTGRRHYRAWRCDADGYVEGYYLSAGVNDEGYYRAAGVFFAEDHDGDEVAS